MVAAAAQSDSHTHLEGVWIFPAVGVFLYYSTKKKKEVLVVHLLPLPEGELVAALFVTGRGGVLAAALFGTGRAGVFVAFSSLQKIS